MDGNTQQILCLWQCPTTTVLVAPQQYLRGMDVMCSRGTALTMSLKYYAVFQCAGGPLLPFSSLTERSPSAGPRQMFKFTTILSAYWILRNRFLIRLSLFGACFFFFSSFRGVKSTVLSVKNQPELKSSMWSYCSYCPTWLHYYEKNTSTFGGHSFVVIIWWIDFQTLYLTSPWCKICVWLGTNRCLRHVKDPTHPTKKEHYHRNSAN